jgi:hypothetical protein
MTRADTLVVTLFLRIFLPMFSAGTKGVTNSYMSRAQKEKVQCANWYVAA